MTINPQPHSSVFFLNIIMQNHLTSNARKPMKRQLRKPKRGFKCLFDRAFEFSIWKHFSNIVTTSSFVSTNKHTIEAREPLAQLVERLTFNQDVESSNLSGLTKFILQGDGNDIDAEIEAQCAPTLLQLSIIINF